MANNEQGESGRNSRKRRYASDLMDSLLLRVHGNRNINPEISQSGPIYPVEDKSLILNQDFLSEFPEEAWNERNPNGVVPVVVNPDLVSGVKFNDLKLSDDQKNGIKFLWDCYENNKGGILAHDTGLGKTRTCITTIATLLQQSSGSKGKSSPALTKVIIIAPKNAVTVWQSEFDKWCTDNLCKVVTIVSGQRDGFEIIEDFEKNNVYNVMILSYETFKKHINNVAAGFAKYSQDSIGLVLCDEAHKLKNVDTNIVKSLRKFKGAKLWMGITGTPYQNNLNELCSLVEFFRRDLEAYDFKKAYCKPINDTLRQLKKLTPQTQNSLMELRSLLRPALHYKRNSFNIERHEVILNIALDGHPGYFKLNLDDSGDDMEQVQHRMFELISESLLSTNEIHFNEKISYLAKACIHPQEAYKALHKHPNLFELAINYFEANFPQDDEMHDPRAKYIFQAFCSTKIRVATQILNEILETRPGEKVIMVSGSTVLLKKIEGYATAVMNVKSVTFDGEKSSSERDRALNLFENDDNYRLLLLSLKAGGTALTLTRANHIIILDPDYNPANDRQAFGRIYRIGQNRTAFIYRLICTGTLEEVKFLLQLEKDSMGNTFEAQDEDVDYNVIAPYDNQELLQYFSQTKSHLNDKLEAIDMEAFNDDDMEGSNFASELIKSRKYIHACDVPDELNVLRKVWESVSHCFHIQKTVDPLTQYLLSDQFEIVDGVIRLQLENDN